MRLITKGKISKKQINKVKSYCKKFKTRGLTIILTSEWNVKKYLGKRYNIHGKGVFVFDNKNKAVHMGIKKVRIPFIIINMKEKDWFDSLLHEFGHYIHYKHFNYFVKKARERYDELSKVGNQETFAELFEIFELKRLVDIKRICYEKYIKNKEKKNINKLFKQHLNNINYYRKLK